MTTEQRGAERGAERNSLIGDHLFQAMFMAMDEGAVSRNGTGEIVAVNPAAENILGLSATELTGLSSADFARTLNFVREDETPFPWEDDPGTLALQTGKPQRNVLMGAHRPDGTLVWISFNAQPLLSDGESRPYGVVMTFRDVTERKRIEVEVPLPNPRDEMRMHHVRYVAERDANGEIVGALGFGRDVTERKASERQLRQALEFTEGVINAIPDLLFEVDQVGTYLNIWARSPELLAAEKAVLLGKTVSDVMPPDAAEVALSAIREADEKGLSFGKVLRLDLPQGEHWFELSVSKKPGSDVPGRFIVLSRNVTERRRMEQAVAVREQEFRSLAENSRDRIIRYDRDGRIRYLNSELLTFFGMSATDIVGRRSSEVWPDGRYAEIEQMCAHAVETGEAATVELAVTDAIGALRIHQVDVVPERDSAGQIVGALSFGRDITALRETERKLRHFIENLPGVAYTFRLSPDGHADFPYISPAIKELYGLDPDDVKDDMAPLHMLAHPEDRPRIEAAITESAGTMTPYHVECRVCRPGQPERWLDQRSVPEREADGSIMWYGIMLDITERKLAEEYEQFRSRTLELVSRGAPLPAILEGIVRGVEQLKPDMICSIVLLDSQGKRFCKVIGPSLPDSYNAGLDGLEIGIGVGSCGTAAATGERVIVEDIQTHPYWAPYKEIAAGAGLAACWSEPIRASTGQVLGTFAAYHRQAHSPAAFDISLIEKSTHLVSIAIERRRSEEALRASEMEFRSLAENMPDGVVRYDRQARAKYMNPEIKANIAPEAQPVLGESLLETFAGNDMVPADLHRMVERVIATGMPFEVELQLPNLRGEMRHRQLRYVAERDDNDEIVGALCIGRDVTEHKRAEEYERFRSQTLELLSRGASLPDILESIVRGVEQLDRERICSILLLDSDGKHFCKGIAPSLPESYNAALYGLEIGVGVGCCGTAAATGKRVIADDLTTHPYWAPYKELVATAGLGACWSEPIHASTGEVLGTFAVYHRHAHSPAPFDIALIEKSTHLVSIAIERKRAQEALRTREREFRTLAENLPDFLVRYDREGRRTYINPTMERVFALGPEEMLGSSLRQDNPAKLPMPQAYLRALEHTLATGERSEFEMQFFPAGGGTRTGLCFIVAERGSDGQITGAIAVSRDITEQKRTEARLALQARRAEVLLELPDVSEAMDEVAFMQRGQELSEELTGSSIAFIHFVNEGEDSIDLVTCSRRTLEHYCRASFDKHYPTSQAGIWADALRQRRPVVFNDYAAYPHKRGLPEGHAELTRLISLPVIENGKVVMLSGVGNKPTDYTDLDVETVQLIANEIWRIVQRKRTDKQLEEHRCHLERLVESRTQALSSAKEAAEVANRAKSHFLAAASHDLRQPLQAIRLFNDALARAGLSERQKSIYNSLAKSVTSLDELLNDLLDLSRLDAGTIEPQPAMIHAEDLLDTIGLEFDAVCREKNLELRLVYPRRSFSLFSDENLLLTLLRNLVSNAVKYTRRGGVLVGIRRQGDRALIQVWDTGVGIPPNQTDSIFEEYFQIGNPERDRAKGVGLGLSIVKRLSKLLDVGVRFRSREGKGSVFEVRVPLAGELDMPASPLQTYANLDTVVPSRLAGKRIVVIEDDGAAGEAIKLTLELEGAAVMLFNAPEEALGSVEAMGADYYLSDYRLPGMNGQQFLDAMQKKSAAPIAAVLLTGNVSPDQMAVLRSSRWKVIFKPVALAELLSALDAHECVH